MRPGELCRVLNSTPLGEVINERVLQRHRTSAGLRIDDGSGRGIDLFRYVAWLVVRRERGSQMSASAQHAGPSTSPALSGYDLHRERARQRNAQLSLSGRDIGEIPPVADPGRKAACSSSFRSFCERYFPQTFQLAWSEDHLRVIERIENAVLEGGLFAMAMPRGSGKTSLCEIGCLWSLVYGHRDFVALIGADEEHAASMLDSIKAELENNDALLDDFPEVCFPIRALEGIHQRAGGQLHLGKQTNIGWTAREIVLPSIAGSNASGSVVRVAGITGRIRGMKHKRADGASIRPSLVLIDDPQTDESARSPSQVSARERILSGAILGLAGPGRKIAGLMTLTVVSPGDLADRLLDLERHPHWHGERTKMVYAFPTNVVLWEQYASMRREELRDGGKGAKATAFYAENRELMDDGASVAWSARFNHDELSAIQHAMNLRIDNERAFFAEYQNEPMADEVSAAVEVSVDDVMLRTNGLKRGLVPADATHLTMFVDVQGKALYWLVSAWRDDFAGAVVDYGTWPDQRSAHFTLRDIRRTLQAAAPKSGIEGAIRNGLEKLCEEQLEREFAVEGGGRMRVSRALVDASWGSSTDVVYEFCARSKFAAVVSPSHGRYVGASSVQWHEYRKKRGERTGLHWRVPVSRGKRSVRHVLYDTNFWKSFVQARLSMAVGDPGALSLFDAGRDGHRMFAEHVTSETRTTVTARGKTVDEWRLRSPGLDNHYLDCIVGAAVAASMLGSAIPSISGEQEAPARKMRLSEMQRARRRR
jgi:hypothetical protein